MRCEGCGREARPGDAFCRGCGAKLAGGEEPVAPGGAGVGDVEGAAAAGAEEATTSPRGKAETAQAGPAAEEPGAAPLTPPPAQAPPLPFPPPPAAHAETGKTSGWAVASLVLGIVSFLCLPFLGGVLAVVFGIIAKSGIKNSRERLGGSGLATAGIVLGIVNLSFLIIMATSLVPWFVVNIGRTQTIRRTVAAQGAESVSARLEMDAGELRVSGGAGEMFEGSFTYNVKRWEPEIDYRVRQGLGELSVKQGGEWWFPTFWFIRNDWDIRFRDGIPLDLTAVLSSGNGRFDLGTLALRSLDVKASSGSILAELSGDLPDLRRVSIDGSSGDIDLALNGVYKTYIQLEVENSSGDIAVNLLGQWESTLGASIRNSSGDVTLQLPKEVGVRVRARTRSGDINAPGMTVDAEDGEGTVYVNEAFRRSLITLQIDVEVSSGDIVLLLAE